MPSISSMISFFVLLLATYSYSAPIVPEFEGTTVEYEVINATLIDESSSVMVPVTSSHIHSGVKSKVHGSTSSEESHSEEMKNAFTRSPRTYEDSTYTTATDLNESSTVEDSSSMVMIPKRGIDVESFTDVMGTTEQHDIEDSSSTGMNDKRTVEDFLFTTIESSTEFNHRAIRPIRPVEEKIESSTIVSSEYQPEMSTDVQPSSSVDSFVKFTGLLHDQPSTTFEYETTSQTEEDFTTQSPVTSETATKILSIIPGTISETKIVINRPTVVPVLVQRVDQKQLSQVGNETIVEETKSDN